MNWLYISLTLILLVTMAVGMIRIVVGPTAADRMMTAQLFGTSGVAILLLFAKGFSREVLMDIALVFALLATLATMTFVRRTWELSGTKKNGNPL